MTRAEMAKAIRDLWSDEKVAFLNALCERLEAYKAQTHVETYALEDIIEGALADVRAVSKLKGN